MTRERRSAKTQRTTFELMFRVRRFDCGRCKCFAYRFILPYSRVYTFFVFCFVCLLGHFSLPILLLVSFPVELAFLRSTRHVSVCTSPYSPAVLDADTRCISRSVDVVLASATKVSFKCLVSLGLMLRTAFLNFAIGQFTVSSSRALDRL